jgi:hypothetical protein
MPDKPLGRTSAADKAQLDTLADQAREVTELIIPSKAGIQKGTGFRFRVEAGMTIRTINS